MLKKCFFLTVVTQVQAIVSSLYWTFLSFICFYQEVIASYMNAFSYLKLFINFHTSFLAIHVIPGGWVNKNNPLLKKYCSLNTKARILKVVLFNCRYVQLDSVIHAASIDHSFPRILKNFCRKRLSKTCKNECKRQTKLPWFSSLTVVTLTCIHLLCPLVRVQFPEWVIYSRGGGDFSFSLQDSTF